jgi:maltose alpha-D-glucosyltransferase/alpha-amylase
MPAFVGAIEWKSDSDAILLGIMQVMVENHGDGYSFVLELMNNYIEKILSAKENSLHPDERLGSLVDPLPFDKLPEQLQVLLGAPAAEQVNLLGVRTGQMHLALASGITLIDFRPENFSLYYQRSLFSSMQSLVRETFQSLSRNLKKLPDEIKQQATGIMGKKSDILSILKKIYSKKLDVIKIRIHGNYQLGQILLTGKDIAIQDYGGDASQSYSERRLKRSALRDVASMIVSLHYVAYEGFLKNNHIPKENTRDLLPFAALWAHYMSGFFTRGWIETVQGTALVPKQKEDLDMMLQVYLLQQALRNFNYELNNHPDWAIIPLGIIKSIVK